MTKTKEPDRRQEKRIRDAARNITELLKRIEPFIRKSHQGAISTEGRWERSSNIGQKGTSST